jgi:hypothetical protein
LIELKMSEGEREKRKSTFSPFNCCLFLRNAGKSKNQSDFTPTYLSPLFPFPPLSLLLLLPTLPTRTLNTASNTPSGPQNSLREVPTHRPSMEQPTRESVGRLDLDEERQGCQFVCPILLLYRPHQADRSLSQSSVITRAEQRAL